MAADNHARKLKTFQTSLGFYDLAIGAPSMKAALEAGSLAAISSLRASLRRRTIPTHLPSVLGEKDSGPNHTYKVPNPSL